MQIQIGDVPLAIRQILEPAEGLAEILWRKGVTQLLQTAAEGIAPGQFAQADATLLETNGAGVHDLVGDAVLEHTVLVDTGLMGKGVGPHNGLVGLHQHACEVGDQSGGAVNLFGVDGCQGLFTVGRATQEGIEQLAAHMHGHDQLLQGGITGPLPNAVDGAFQLAGAGPHGRQEVGHHQTQIVVTMNGDHRLIHVGHMGVNARNQSGKLFRRGVPHGVGNVDGGGPCGNGGLDHLIEEFRITAGGVFAGEFNVVAERCSIGNHLRHDLQHLTAGFAQLVFEVNVAGGDEGVDALTGSRSNGSGTGFNVPFGGTGEPADHWAVVCTHHLGDTLHCRKIPFAGEGETGLDDVHVEPSQLLGNHKLFFQIEAGAWGLLPVAERGVENKNAAGILGPHGPKRRR